MKKIVMFVLVAILVVVGLANIRARGEEAPAIEVELSKVKTFTTEGQLEGTWILSFEKDENGYYRCAFDMGDGRVVMFPLTDAEVDRLMVKAVDEIRQKTEAEQNQTDDRTFIVKAVDWITFWN